MLESDVIARLRAIATHPAARGLADDAAVLAAPLGRDLVLTHDMLAEGVHFIGDEPPADLAHKLFAVNLSDLAAMGARPLGVLLGLGLARQDAAWADAFAAGLAAAAARWRVPLLGGDTVAGLDRLVLGLTAIGQVAPGRALGRAGARAGDTLWVTGNIGDAGLGLAVARGDAPCDADLLARYRRPEPQLAMGAALVGIATAAIDVSDGLLIDAARLAAAGGVSIGVDLGALPMSRAAEKRGADQLGLATSGDDYELLFAAPATADVAAIGRRLKLRVSPIGVVTAGSGLEVRGVDGTIIDPARLGWEHATR